MRNVLNGLRDLLRDTRPGQWKEPPPPTKEELEARKAEAPSAAPPTRQDRSGPVRSFRKDHVKVPTPGTAPTTMHTTQSGPTQQALDPQCEHKPSYKNGVKFCWLCGGAYPLDERPPSPWGQRFRK